MYPAPIVVRNGGRELTVEDAGPAAGLPLLVHGGGGSRHLFPPLAAQARGYGFRLIGYDRPAYGGSTPLPGRTVGDCAQDVAAIAAKLEIARLAVWGFSGGGPYALATAALLPEAVAAVCVLAPLGPYGEAGLDFLAGLDDSYREEVDIFFADREAAREKFRADGAEMFGRLAAPEGWLRIWGDRAGQDPAHDYQTARYLADVLLDGWTNGDDGWWDDWSAFLSPWGFDLESIAAPVSLWHGLADTRCPPAHSRWLAERIPHVTAHFTTEDDHTTVESNNSAAAFEWLRSTVPVNPDAVRRLP